MQREVRAPAGARRNQGGGRRETGRAAASLWPRLFAILIAFVAGTVFGIALVITVPFDREGPVSPLAAEQANADSPQEAAAVTPALAAPVTDSATVAATADPATPLPIVQGTISGEGDPELQAVIANAIGGTGGSTSVVVLRPSDGLFAAVNADQVYYAASLFKLEILYEAERRVSTGDVTLDDPVIYTAEAISEDLGTLGALSLSSDGTLPLGDALAAMVELSDNSSAIAIMRFLGARSVDEATAALGLEASSINTTELPTTARDMARLMQAIVGGEGVTETQRDHMRSLLLAQHTRDGIPAALPEDVLVGNKTGTWDDATHDVAFVDAPGGEYVIAVLSNRGWDWATIQNVSAAVYRYLSAN
jgi:beta-lactamase class A